MELAVVGEEETGVVEVPEVVGDLTVVELTAGVVVVVVVVVVATGLVGDGDEVVVVVPDLQPERTKINTRIQANTPSSIFRIN